MNRWKVLGWLPLILLWSGYIIWMVARKQYGELGFFILILITFYLAIKWGKYCAMKERKP